MNFYEFLAAGVAQGDLDEHLIRRGLRGQFMNFYVQTEDDIAFWRIGNTAIWADLAAMYTRWNGL